METSRKRSEAARRSAWVALVSSIAAVAAALPAYSLPPSPGHTCYAIVTTAIVCSLGSCETSFYVDDYWCSRTFFTDINPGDRNPADQNFNRVIDDHHDVLATNDWCAWVFDTNDRLGTAYGGSNTTRPSHNGIDIQADYGDSVGSVAHGYVTRVGWQNPADHNEGCGFRIELSHPTGDTSTYCHLVPDSNSREVGDWVRAGTILGQADHSGNSTGDHLHLIYKSGGTAPLEYWTKTGTQPTPAELNGNC